MEEDILSNLDPEINFDSRIKTVIVVRHAESFANTQGIYQGQSYDTDLSELGRKQAEALAERLESFELDKIITSPLKRAYKTAEAVFSRTGSEIEVNELIIETNHGVWEGKQRDWIIQKFPDLYELWQEKPSRVVFPEGEMFMDTVRRTLNFLENTTFESSTLVVTHDNIIRVMISLIKNTDIDKMWQIPLETASLNFFEVNKVRGKNVFRVLRQNEIDHLVGLRNNIEVHAL